MKNKSLCIFLLCLLLVTTALTVTAKNRTAKLKIQTVKVEVNERGYKPETIKLRRGTPARIIFLRKTNAACAKEVVFSDYGIKRELPLNKAVVVSFTPKKTGEFNFSCGMDMMRGKLIVR